MADKTDTASSRQQNLQKAFARLFADFLAMRRVLHSQCSDRWAVHLNDARRIAQDRSRAQRLADELLAQIRCDTPASEEASIEVLNQLTTLKDSE
jgi:hypothetical protein